jgi:hypothetical protein
MCNSTDQENIILGLLVWGCSFDQAYIWLESKEMSLIFKAKWDWGTVFSLEASFRLSCCPMEEAVPLQISNHNTKTV